MLQCSPTRVDEGSGGSNTTIQNNAQMCRERPTKNQSNRGVCPASHLNSGEGYRPLIKTKSGPSLFGDYLGLHTWYGGLPPAAPISTEKVEVRIPRSLCGDSGKKGPGLRHEPRTSPLTPLSSIVLWRGSLSQNLRCHFGGYLGFYAHILSLSPQKILK